MNDKIKKQVSQDDNAIVTLLTVQDSEDRSVWVLMRMTMDNFEHYMQAQIDREQVNLTTLGEVLDTGWGLHPDETELQTIYKTYGDLHMIDEVRDQVRETLNI